MRPRSGCRRNFRLVHQTIPHCHQNATTGHWASFPSRQPLHQPPSPHNGMENGPRDSGPVKDRARILHASLQGTEQSEPYSQTLPPLPGLCHATRAGPGLSCFSQQACSYPVRRKGPDDGPRLASALGHGASQSSTPPAAQGQALHLRGCSRGHRGKLPSLVGRNRAYASTYLAG